MVTIVANDVVDFVVTVVVVAVLIIVLDEGMIRAVGKVFSAVLVAAIVVIVDMITLVVLFFVYITLNIMNYAGRAVITDVRSISVDLYRE